MVDFERLEFYLTFRLTTNYHMLPQMYTAIDKGRGEFVAASCITVLIKMTFNLFRGIN